METKKKTRKDYYVSLYFENYQFTITATSAKEAKEKALAKLSRKKLSSMLDKNNTDVNVY